MLFRVVGIVTLISTLASATFQSPLVTPSCLEETPFLVIRDKRFPEHTIRIKQQNATLCDTNVTQHTGWLDIGHVHLFFWYFASQQPAKEPEDSPLTLWMSGGPGCSSMLGLFQELGPCLINDHGNGTVHNPYGWNKETALLFVDQPAGVGFSYVDEGTPMPDTSFIAAVDMHIFLQMLFSVVFPQHAKGPFHIAGDSYAGHYIPTLGAQILTQNALHASRPQIPLKSVLIGNGYISPLDTTYGYWETLCTTNPGVKTPIFNATRCDIMAANMPRCIDLMRVCYDHPDPAICKIASDVCSNSVTGLYTSEAGTGGRNVMDITAPCESDDNCYPRSALFEKYLNSDFVWDALGVPSKVPNFSIMRGSVVDAFALTNDLGISTERQVRFLLENEVDVLLYQGNLDLDCNTAGNLRWANSMSWFGGPAFSSLALSPWNTTKAGEDITAGMYKEVAIQMNKESQHKTRFTFVTIAGAGHLVPQDEPEVALAMLSRWLRGGKWAGIEAGRIST